MKKLLLLLLFITLISISSVQLVMAEDLLCKEFLYSDFNFACSYYGIEWLAKPNYMARWFATYYTNFISGFNFTLFYKKKTSKSLEQLNLIQKGREQNRKDILFPFLE